MRWPLRRVAVAGPSMAPTLRPGDQLLVWRGRRPTARPGAVVVVALPDRPMSVKRLVRVGVDGALWVEGDNARGSTDSRQLGALPAAALWGRVVCRYWPLRGSRSRS